MLPIERKRTTTGEAVDGVWCVVISRLITKMDFATSFCVLHMTIVVAMFPDVNWTTG